MQVFKPLEVDVQHGDMGPQPRRRPGRVGAHRTAAQDHNIRRRNAGNAHRQKPPAALRLSQIERTHQHRHAPGNLAHRL